MNRSKQHSKLTSLWKPWIFSLFGWAVMVLCPASSYAYTASEEQQELYQVVLVAPSRLESDRNALFRAGLQSILQKITGKAEIFNEKAIKQALSEPNRYVAQFGYLGENISIGFSQDLINDLVFSVGQPVWGAQKPTLVLWLAVNQNQNRKIVGSENDPGLSQQIQQFSQERGLSLVMPLMDLSDLNQVNATDVWGGFPSVLNKASRRYDADAILVARLNQQPDGQWSSHWQLLLDEHDKTWELNAKGYEDLIEKGIDQVTRHLLSRYGLKYWKKSTGAISIGIQDINSIGDFAKAEAYLDSLDQVKDVHVKEVSGYGVIFEIKPEADVDPEILSQVIGMDNHMVSLAKKDQKVESTDLTYRWAP